MLSNLHLSTVAIHAGRGDRIEGGPLNPPLVLASNFHGGAYAREQGSPAWAALEQAIGVLEGGTATAFASGVGAAAAVLETVPTGARVVGPTAGYAWTRSLLHERAEQGRIVLSEVDTTDTEATLAAAKDAALLWLESPSNPLIEITELDRILPTLRDEPVKVAVDSTFATPLLQQPLRMGAHFSLQSATKFIGGHGDLMLGLVSTRDADDAASLRHVRAQAGATPGAMEAWLALRGLRVGPSDQTGLEQPRPVRVSQWGLRHYSRMWVIRLLSLVGRIVVESCAPAFYDDATGPRLTRGR